MLRKNGSLSSCEACRRSKIRCDHKTPTCGKCASRSMPCEYRIAPMTQTRSSMEDAMPPPSPSGDGGASWFGVLDLSSLSSPSNTSSHQQQPRPSARGRISPSSVQPQCDDGVVVSSLRTTQLKRKRLSSTLRGSPQSASHTDIELGITNAATDDVPELSTPHERHLGCANPNTTSVRTNLDHTYHGMTSSVSALQEAIDPPNRSTVQANIVDHYNRPPAPPVAGQLELGAWVVAQLEHIELVCAFAERYIQISLVSPVATLIPIDFIRSLKEYVPVDLQSPVECQRVARKISENSAQAIKADITLSARAFIALYAGESLRWEFLGLIFAWAGRAAAEASTRSTDISPPPNFSGTAYAHHLLNCSDSCLSLHRPTAPISDMYIWCLYANLVLTSSEYGEGSQFPEFLAMGSEYKANICTNLQVIKLGTEWAIFQTRSSLPDCTVSPHARLGFLLT